LLMILPDPPRGKSPSCDRIVPEYLRKVRRASSFSQFIQVSVEYIEVSEIKILHWYYMFRASSRKIRKLWAHSHKIKK